MVSEARREFEWTTCRSRCAHVTALAVFLGMMLLLGFSEPDVALEIRILRGFVFVVLGVVLFIYGFGTSVMLSRSWVLGAQGNYAVANGSLFLCWSAFSVRHAILGLWVDAVVIALFFFPVALLACRGQYLICKQGQEMASDESAEYAEQLESATQRAFEQTIRFDGHVVPGKGVPCVCSWPGKYVSAWDELVRRSREGKTSAAVVFLPEGTEAYGLHDPIPASEKLPGSCWCTVLYGEEKSWGCRWWSEWIANVEQAVEYQAELQVYFFQHCKGRGKVANFATAGQQHLRREAVQARRREFKESRQFQLAVAAGLGGLSQQPRGDGSSAYSREVDRRFLEWLSADERELLHAAEGLGNSQKAEVAWLEHKGYSYTEVEVDLSGWMADEEEIQQLLSHHSPSEGTGTGSVPDQGP